MTIFDKIWKSHIVKEIPDGPSILYIDRHYIHEVTSPQAFSGLKQRGRKVFKPSQTFATCDHNVPTINQELPIGDPSSRIPLEQLEANTKEHGITYFPLGNPNNGVVHIIGPELGITLPGMTVVCGDSHTSTHGAFGSIAFGIGTSEVEMVLATQTLLQNKPKQMLIRVEGELARGVCAKDLILYIISRLGTSAGTGHFIEFAGSAIESLSMEGRMTICNMSIEMGARGGLIAPDQKTINYIKGREYSPKVELWESSVNRWMELKSDAGAHYDAVFEIDAAAVEPMITWGTNPGMGMAVNGSIPLTGLDEMSVKALKYMDFPESEFLLQEGEYLLQEGEQLLKKGYQLLGLPVDYIFLGSCTNGRIEDFRAFAGLVKGRQKASGVTAWLVPGSKMVERQIEDEGLGDILRNAGFEVRQPGCSACLGMNDDKVPTGKYCISTTNRNFEGRQGPGARTILAGPLVAAAAAVTGIITDPRDFQKKFTIVESRAVVIPLDNIDTDQIIPARFLKTTSREGFGEKLFYDWRYDASGEAVKEFVLNSTNGAGTILVAGRNFGCGSSREHAAWAVADYGFRAVVSTSFADIFRSNALNNGLLPVQVSENFLKSIIELSKSKKDITLKIDLMKKEITNQETGDSEKFEINPYKQECLINGYDDIDYLLSNIKEIEEYELYKASSL